MGTARSFARLPPASLSQQVCAELRRSIFEGRLLPGSPLREQRLAMQFGVSQNTVREALVELQRCGLVERVPNRATHVTKLSDEEIRERIAVRLPLEELACASAAHRMSADDLGRLCGRLEDMNRCQSSNDHVGYAAADLEFHRLIWQAGGNRTLYRTLDELTAPLFAFISILQHERAVVTAEVARSHNPLFEALRAGDAGLARAAVRAHVADGYERVLRWISKAGKPMPER